ncbi:MAG: hypothetical protein D6830_02870 [Ignavibacteria bacterium]|nr:MAG: hypothetical protein D6830_02870 [Ignavibacteria bacterium]
MPENSKYDFFMDELNSLEKQIYQLIQKSEVMLEEQSALQKKIEQLEAENEVLRLKIEELESFNPGRDLSGLSNEDRSALKAKIDEFISKIDNHIGS